MKKLSAFAIAITCFFCASASSIPEEMVSKEVKFTLSKTYRNAHDIKWEKIEDTYYASFYLKNKDVTVAFSEDGEILAESRDVPVTTLPGKISASLSVNFKGYVFNTQATEVKSNGMHTYFVICQDQNFWVRLRYNTDGSYEVVKEIRKQAI